MSQVRVATTAELWRFHKLRREGKTNTQATEQLWPDLAGKNPYTTFQGTVHVPQPAAYTPPAPTAAVPTIPTSLARMVGISIVAVLMAGCGMVGWITWGWLPHPTNQSEAVAAAPVVQVVTTTPMNTATTLPSATLPAPTPTPVVVVLVQTVQVPVYVPQPQPQIQIAERSQRVATLVPQVASSTQGQRQIQPQPQAQPVVRSAVPVYFAPNTLPVLPSPTPTGKYVCADGTDWNDPGWFSGDKVTHEADGTYSYWRAAGGNGRWDAWNKHTGCRINE